ncbi:IclR family transcriptional regulator [Ramlibacter sp.]|uniref:IclR family transcriptional regulator n=1 Tax=Ramlibacter sp. TaxID=1917967 RepID=UPI002FC78A02
MAEPSPKSLRVVSSVRHAARILRILGGAIDPMSMSDVARRVNLSKTATYHLLKTLELEKFVAKDSAARYRLSWGVYELGSSVIRPVELTRVARVYVDKLATDIGEVVLLGIVDEGSVLYVDRVASAGATDMLASAGRRTALHATASGKLLLAHQRERFVQATIEAGLPGRTRATICDGETLKTELARIRANGYATCWQEFDNALSSVAAPVIDYTGSAIAALAIAGSSERITPASLPGVLKQLLPTAAAISAELGAPAVFTRVVG